MRLNIVARVAYAALLLSAVSVLLTVLLFSKVNATTDDIRAEGKGRRDQSCTQSEREHLAKVNELKRTYDFLTDPAKSKLLSKDLRQLIIIGLPQTEREAHIDPAPEFCDEPGIGLPEPDPKVPARPKSLR